MARAPSASAEEVDRARAAFACDTQPASGACAAITRYADGHAPAAPTHGVAYLGIRHRPGDGAVHTFVQLVVAPDAAGARISESIGAPGDALVQAWPELQAALARTPVASDDPEVASLLTATRRSPALVPPNDDLLVADAAHDHAVVQTPFGTTTYREREGHLIAIAGNGGVTDLVPVGDVEIDADPIVRCQSQSFVEGLTFAQCEDGHTYGAHCTDEGACTCVRDETEGSTFVHEGGGFLSGREVRAQCHYPIR